MGEVKGNIFASKKLVIHSNGKVYGDIKSPSLVIEDGGFFHGKSLMQDIEQMDEEKVVMISSQKMIERVHLENAAPDTDQLIKPSSDERVF